jgi:cell division protein FtsA
VIPIAGDQVTNDIAVSMRTPTQYAEDIKIKYACALSQLANPDESVEVPSVGDRPARRLARQTLAEVVEPRTRNCSAWRARNCAARASRRSSPPASY